MPFFFSCNPRCAESESETRLINFKVFWFLLYTFDSVCLCLSVLHQPAYLPYCVLLCLQHNGVLLFPVFPHVPAPVQVLVMLYCWTRKSLLYSSFNYLELDIDSRWIIYWEKSLCCVVCITPWTEKTQLTNRVPAEATSLTFYFVRNGLPDMATQNPSDPTWHCSITKGMWKVLGCNRKAALLWLAQK